ncbi:MAG: hypothetical protein U5L00_06765 [Desulfovermiculus sp.]|nr:hypothetical protein [Desulfovermiculus sp.]
MHKEQIARKLIDAYRDRYPDGLVPPNDASRIVRLQASYLATMRSRGGGPPAVKSGNRIYYPLNELAEWFAERSVQKR